MHRVDFVVSVGADYQQMCHVLLNQQILQKVECCRIEPLQVVEKQRQRMLRARENADKLPKSKLCAGFPFLRW